MKDWPYFPEGTEGAKAQCPSCDGHNVTTTLREQRFAYGAGEKAIELKVPVPVHHCADCDIDFTDGFSEALRHAAVCEHLRVMTPDEVSSVRKTYGLSRAEFARITKIGEASIARWENATLIQNGAYDQLLFLLTYPENFERLRKRTEETEWHFDEGAKSLPVSSRFKVLSMTGRFERKRQESEGFFLRRAG
jgi:putative zinc finger/helix-turn-helix YgiT family protein